MMKKDGGLDCSCSIPIPVVISKEDNWFIAGSPILDIATQGKTEEEAKKNMEDLIGEYYKDPDTAKPEISSIMALSVSIIPVQIAKKENEQIKTINTTESN